MGDILKEAIADAKAVRETALQNAKMALEEAFTPQLKSMLSAKLKEEEDEAGEEEVAAESAPHGGAQAMEVPPTTNSDEDEEVMEYNENEMEVPDEVVPSDDEEEAVAETVTLNGRTYRLAEEEDDMDVDDEEVAIEAEMGDEEEDTLDLESVIKELEDELGDEEEVEESVEDTDNAYDEKADSPDKTGGGLAEGEPEAADNAYSEKGSKDDKNDGISSSTLAEQEDEEEVEIDENLFKEEDEEEGEEVSEQSDSSDIGKGDNVVKQADGSDEEDPGAGKLAEYKKAIVFLKNKLHEVNILNAKLLFTNKLFKEFALDNNQKLKVVETFDRTQSTREIKLVYSTLAEQFSDNNSINRNSINESASASIGSTKPSAKSRKVITEESSVANRFKKLAGIIN